MGKKRDKDHFTNTQINHQIYVQVLCSFAGVDSAYNFKKLLKNKDKP